MNLDSAVVTDVLSITKLDSGMLQQKLLKKFRLSYKE